MDELQLAAFKELIQTPTLPELGPHPRHGIRPLRELNEELSGFFTRNAIPEKRQAAFRAAALLWHDHLNASHELSQNIPDSTGSFLHAIMHRREPDYGNAKYWFRRVGPHPAYGPIAAQVSRLGDGPATDVVSRLMPLGQWDPFAFVDQCEAAGSGQVEPWRLDLLRRIQAIEFGELLANL